MNRFTTLNPEEVERRRLASLQALKVLDREAFDQWYRKRCDENYWKFGQRCSGCDFWASEMGDVGECQRGGKIPGREVLASAGIFFCSSAKLEPGYPMTRAHEHCPNFKDEFDWQELGEEYLTEIGAMRDGVLREKPTHRAPA